VTRLRHIIAPTAVVRQFLDREAVQITAPVSPRSAEPGCWEWDSLDLGGDCWRDGCAHGPTVMEGTSDRVRCHWRPGDAVTLRTRNGRHRATARVDLVHAERIEGVWCWRIVLTPRESGPKAVAGSEGE
jgi:hypothetical protein